MWWMGKEGRQNEEKYHITGDVCAVKGDVSGKSSSHPSFTVLQLPFHHSLHFDSHPFTIDPFLYTHTPLPGNIHPTLRLTHLLSHFRFLQPHPQTFISSSPLLSTTHAVTSALPLALTFSFFRLHFMQHKGQSIFLAKSF